MPQPGPPNQTRYTPPTPPNTALYLYRVDTFEKFEGNYGHFVGFQRYNIAMQLVSKGA